MTTWQHGPKTENDLRRKKASSRYFDETVSRDRCARCARILVTGQTRCVCGTTFDGS